MNGPVNLSQLTPGLRLRASQRPRLPNQAANDNDAPDKTDLGAGDGSRELRSLKSSRWGVLGAGALSLVGMTGCSGPAPPAVQVQTQAQKETQKTFAQTLKQLEDGMAETKTGSGQQQVETVTRKLVEATRTYARGNPPEAVVAELRGQLQQHPALAVAAVLAVGEVTVSGLDQLGLTHGAEQGVAKIHEAVNGQRLLAAGLAIPLSAGVAPMVFQMANLEGILPPKPATPAAKKLEESFRGLDSKLQSGKLAPKEARSQTLTAISRYQKESGNPWDQVALDVKALAFDHPVLASNMVSEGGATVNEVLVRSGVDPRLADLLSKVLQSSQGSGKLAGYIRQHPLLGGVVAVGVAAGAGTVAMPKPVLTKAADQTVAQHIDAILAGSPLAGQDMGNHFVAAGRQYDVDPYTLVAISKHETGFGKLGVGMRKHMGVGAWDSDPNAVTPYDGALNQIYYGAKTFKNLRQKGGETSASEMARQLLAVNRSGWASDPRWHSGVEHHYYTFVPKETQAMAQAYLLSNGLQ